MVASTGDVWAVGNDRGASLALRRKGATWVRVATPLPEVGEEDYLHAVDGSGPDDIWAVGYSRISQTLFTKPLVLHWDGSSWTKVHVQSPHGNTYGPLDGITVIGPDDIWAAGDSTGVQDVPLLLHWDGEEWTPSTDVLGMTTLLLGIDDISAAGPDDVWAVGATKRSGVLLHWDGRVWTQMRAPAWDRPYFIDRLWGVHATSSDDVWAVGGHGDHTPPDSITILHWDGHAWTQHAAPNPGDQANRLWDVDATGPDDVWAVGSFDNGDGKGTHHLVLHYNGHKWTRSR